MGEVNYCPRSAGLSDGPQVRRWLVVWPQLGQAWQLGRAWQLGWAQHLHHGDVGPL